MTQTADIRSGQCLCGAVRLSAKVSGSGIQACHCKQCQRWTGGGPLLVTRVKGVEVTGEDAIASYHASDHGERGFCRICGTTLLWKLQGRGIAFLPVGLLDDQSGLEISEEIFVDHRPDWLPEWPGTKRHGEAEMQAQLKAFLEGQPNA